MSFLFKDKKELETIAKYLQEGEGLTFSKFLIDHPFGKKIVSRIHKMINEGDPQVELKIVEYELVDAMREFDIEL
ncbi:MAG: hypothetical protein WC890_04310 [Candidatus Margulisiibacteriota bacterium]